MDFVFGDCVALGGFRYALLLVDVATRYTWIYGLSSFTSSEVIAALDVFCADAGGLPKRFHSDFDKKLIGGKTLKWILANNSNIIAAPLAVSPRMVSPNALGKRSSRWPGVTSPRSRLAVSSGSTPSATPS